MADDVLLPGAGTTIAARNIAGRLFQEMMLTDPLGSVKDPASDDLIMLFMRLLKLAQSLDITDSAGRQRVTIDAIGAANTSVNTAQVAGTAQAVNVGLSSAGTPRVTVALDSQMDGLVAQMRTAYNTMIANNLVFS